MSSDNSDAHNVAECCASCGIAEVDDVKLKECADCDLVRYCSDECQENHTAKHEEACKKRAAELRDELLFKQPDSTHLGDCPICCLPLKLDLSKSSMQTCCSKVVCYGCFHANLFREEKEMLENKCPFCRKPIPNTDAECDKRRMERIEMDDPVAIAHEGVQLYIKGDHEGAFVYYLKAAELGNMEAHYKLSLMYHFGVFGGNDDRKNELWHLEEASIGGHPGARYKLAWLEWGHKRNERAVKHWVIAASQGHDDSLEFLMKKFKGGFVKKEVLAAALRAHQAAVNATKSPQREATEAALGK